MLFGSYVYGVSWPYIMAWDAGLVVLLSVYIWLGAGCNILSLLIYAIEVRVCYAHLVSIRLYIMWLYSIVLVIPLYHYRGNVPVYR
jgi:hypothetical protein